MNLVLYVHGKGGNAGEAEHYKPLFTSCDVVGLDYKSSTPWEAGKEISETVKALKAKYENVILIANSIGAFFCMNANIDRLVSKAFLISPIVDMERLILNAMASAHISERKLRKKGVLKTDSGEELSWEYLTYVREHPIKWDAPTEIFYGDKDNLTPYTVIAEFSQKNNARLTVMKNGEHWFHTEEQMRFIDEGILRNFQEEK